MPAIGERDGAAATGSRSRGRAATPGTTTASTTRASRRPTQVTRSPRRTTFVFDWYVPIEVGATRGYLYGKLFWIGQKGFSFPIGAIIALIVIVIGGVAFVVVVRRRRGPRRRAGGLVSGLLLSCAPALALRCCSLLARRFPGERGARSRSPQRRRRRTRRVALARACAPRPRPRRRRRAARQRAARSRARGAPAAARCARPDALRPAAGGARVPRSHRQEPCHTTTHLIAVAAALCAASRSCPRARRRTRCWSAPSRCPGRRSTRAPREVIFEFNQAVGGTLGAVRVYDAHGDRGRQRRRLPPGRQRALDGRRPAGAPAGRHLHGDLPRDLGRHAHRLRRPGVQHRPRVARRRRRSPG